MPHITPFLWFEKDARKVAQYYASIFKQSKIKNATILNDTPSGRVEVVTIELLGQEFTLMSAGPEFKFTEAISFVVDCKTQKEVDYYWGKLTAEGGQESMCGWLKDKYGLSWQIVPDALLELITSKDRPKATRVMGAMMQMGKLDIKKLKAAAKGK